MNVEDLKRQKELAEQLSARLQEISSLWEQLPRPEDLEELTKVASRLADRLGDAKDTFQDIEFPAVDWLEDLTQAARRLVDTLEAAKKKARQLPEIE